MGLLFRREWMGVEPTAACSAQPATNFEDWGTHRGTTTPTQDYSVAAKSKQLRANSYSQRGQSPLLC